MGRRTHVLYLRSLWIELNFPSDPNIQTTKDKFRYMSNLSNMYSARKRRPNIVFDSRPESLDVSGLLYFARGTSSDFSKPGGFILSSKMRSFLKKFPVNGLNPANFAEDMRVMFMTHRSFYYVPKLRKALSPQMSGIKDIIDSHYYYVISNIKQIGPSDMAKIHSFIYDSPNSKDNVLLSLLRRVPPQGLDIRFEGSMPLIRINTLALSTKNHDLIVRNAIHYSVNPLYPHALCLVETGYVGTADTTSPSGAKGPIQVMPETYSDFSSSGNFATATREQLVEAGIRKIRYDFKQMDVNPSGNINDIITMIFGISYNSGFANIYRIIESGELTLTDETQQYFQFLLVIKNYIRLIV